MCHKSLLTLSAAAAIIAAAIGMTGSTGFAAVTAGADKDRGGLRVINRRCQKALLQFQRTGDDYYLRVYRECLKRQQ